MKPPNVDLGEWFDKGFKLYKDNVLKIIPAAFMALVLTVVSLGVLAGPMSAGLIMITLSALRGGKPVASDVFKGFGFFLNAGIFVLGWGLAVSAVAMILLLLPGIGPLTALFFVYAAHACLMFGPFLIVDRNMDFKSATLTGFNTVKSNFWPFLSVSAVSGVIGSLGCILFGIGVIVTVPLQVCILTVAYEAVLGEGAPAN